MTSIQNDNELTEIKNMCAQTYECANIVKPTLKDETWHQIFNNLKQFVTVNNRVPIVNLTEPEM